NTFTAAEGCNLRVINSRFVGGLNGVHAVATYSGATSHAPVAIEVGLSSGSGNTFTNVGIDMNAGVGACAVEALDEVSPVRVDHNQFANVGCGLVVSSKSAAAVVEIADNEMRDLRYHGIALTQSTKATLSRNTITNVDFNLLGFYCLGHPALCM